MGETHNSESSRKDVYQRVTDKIIEFLEEGASLRERLWVSGAPGRPLRTTNEPYRGINTVLLWVASIERGLEHRHWMTYKAAQKMGANVRKGEKGELVAYADEMVKPMEDKQTGELVDTPIWFWKGYTVFNASQIDGLPAAFYEKPVLKLMDKPERIMSAQRFIANTGANLIEGGAHAFYRPADDTLHMPEIEKFRDVESFYSVAMHECVHYADFRIMPCQVQVFVGIRVISPQPRGIRLASPTLRRWLFARGLGFFKPKEPAMPTRQNSVNPNTHEIAAELFGEQFDAFRQHRLDLAHAGSTVGHHLRCIAYIGEAMKAHSIRLVELDDAQALTIIEKTGWRRKRKIYAAFIMKRFISFLNGRGLARPPSPRTAKEIARAELKGDYES